MWFDDPKTCALYLNDALDTSDASEVADALRVIRQTVNCQVRSLNGGSQMHLAEVFDILDTAGIRLVAIPTKPTASAADAANRPVARTARSARRQGD